MTVETSTRFADAFRDAHRAQPDLLFIDILLQLADPPPAGTHARRVGGYWRMKLALTLAQAERDFAQALGLPIAQIDPDAAQRAGAYAAITGDDSEVRKFTGR